MDFRRASNLLVCLVAGVSLGCEGSYQGAKGRLVASAVTARVRWSVASNMRNPAAAVDGRSGTYAEAILGAGTPQMTLDLGKASLFNLIVLEHGSDGEHFPGRIELTTSLDGESFVPAAVVPGTRRVTSICLVRPVLARYLRFRLLERGPEPLRIAEFYLQ